MTVASNENQSQAQLLRHGELNWVTRGVFLGYQRNYLELQVDDLFLGDDAWDPATHTHQLRPGHGEPHDAGRRRPGRGVVEGARPAHRLRLQRRRQRALQGRPRDDQRSAGRRVRRPGDAQRLRLHQPHLRAPEPRLLDVVLHRQGRSPTTSPGPRQHGLPLDPDRGRHRRALGPGQHAARATPARSTRRRFDDVDARGRRHDRRPAPTTTRVTAQSPAGETTASVVPGVAVRRRPEASTASFNAVCHAVAYNLYRSAGGRQQLDAGRHARARGHGRHRRRDQPDRADDHRHRRGGHGRGAAGGQRRRAGALRAEPELPRRASSPRASRSVATDASKAYPSTPTDRQQPAVPGGRDVLRGQPCAGRPALPEQRLLQRLQARASSSTSTTGSTSRRPTAAAACRSRASPRAARRRRRGPST